MTNPRCSRDQLESNGFLVDGIAQTLRAMSTSDSLAPQIGMSLDLLAGVAEEVAEYISAHVAASAPDPVFGRFNPEGS